MGYSAAQYQRAITTISYFLSPEEKIGLLHMQLGLICSGQHEQLVINLKSRLPSFWWTFRLDLQGPFLSQKQDSRIYGKICNCSG